MNARIKYHIRKYVIRTFFYILGFWGIAVIFSFLETLDGSDFDGIGLFRLCVVVGMVYLFSGMWEVMRFTRMIRRQEEQFGIQFSDADALPFQQSSMNCISGDWFIRSGTYALYRGYLSDVTCKNYKHLRVNNRTGYKFTVKTTDGKKYQLWFRTANDAETFSKWSGYVEP